MTILHKDIPNDGLHEPKNIITAPINSAYFSNGAGSGTWTKVGSQHISGLSGDGGNSNRKIITNGSGGFSLAVDNSYGAMVVNNNNNNFAITAAVDATLNTNSDFVLFTGTGAPWSASGLEFGGVTFTTDRLTVATTGVYRIDLWASVIGFPTNTAKIAAKYRISGGATYSTRRPIVKSNSAGDADQLSGFGLVSLVAGDYIQLYLASTATGNIVINDMNLTLDLIRQTA